MGSDLMFPKRFSVAYADMSADSALFLEIQALGSQIPAGTRRSPQEPSENRRNTQNTLRACPLTICSFQKDYRPTLKLFRELDNYRYRLYLSEN